MGKRVIIFLLLLSASVFAEENNCKSGYLFAIKTIDDRFIGVLGIDYTKETKKLDDDVINHIMVQSSSLGGVLMNHLQQ